MPNRGQADQHFVSGFLAALLLGVASCGGTPQPQSPGETERAALMTDGGDRSRTARAAYYTAEVARLRQIAREERDLSAAYARRTPPARTTKDWNATLKARVEARAAAADQIAAKLQTLADFQTAEAAKEMAR